MCSVSSYYEKILATGEVKCIDDEIPFEIPKGWEWCRMGSIGDWGAGATPTKGNPDYYGGSILWLRTGELNNGVVYDSEIKVTEKALQECSLRMNRIGDVLIAMYGATIGKVAIVGKELTTNQACCACTPFGIYNYYLFFFLLGSQIDFIKKGEGGAQPNISREKLVSHLMPIPPLVEQHRIVEKIQYLFPLVEKYSDSKIVQDKLNSEIKDKLRKSILQEAIQGKLVPQIAEEGTAHELLEQIKAEKLKLVKEGKLKKYALNDSVIFRSDDSKYYEQVGKKCLDITEELPFDLPNNWAWCRLGNLVSITSGENLTSKQMHNGKIPVYGGNGITGYHSKANIFEETIVIGRVGYYCGSIHLTPCQAWVTDNAFITQYSKLLNRDFLIYLLTALNLSKCCNATAQPVVSGKKIYPLLIALPPFKEQQRIVAQIEKLFEQLR